MKGINLQNIFLTCTILIVVFSGLFLFLADEGANSTVPIGADLNDTYNNLTAELNVINSSIGAVKEKAMALSESKTTGVGGLVVTTIEGFSATVKLMTQSLAFGFDTVMIFLKSMGPAFIPEWIMAAIFLVLTIVVFFAFLRAVSGRSEI